MQYPCQILVNTPMYEVYQCCLNQTGPLSRWMCTVSFLCTTCPSFAQKSLKKQAIILQHIACFLAHIQHLFEKSKVLSARALLIEHESRLKTITMDIA